MTIFTTSLRAEGISTSSSTISFGWFKKLDEAQMNGHLTALQQALLYADNGEAVHWRKNRAWGFTRILHTDADSKGYCRTIYIEVVAFNKKKTDVHKYCFANNTETWYQSYIRR